MSWQQKSRALWLKELDRNTEFFHRLANLNLPNNFIGALEIGDSLTEDQDALKSQIEQFYSTLYQESEPWRPKLDGMPFNSLDEESATFLERYFEEDEILQAQEYGWR